MFVQPEDPINPGAVEDSYLHGLPQGSPEAQGLAATYRANLQRCLDFIHDHPAWRLGVQMHKYVQLP